MAIQYDINKIFEELEQQIRRKDKKHEKVDSTKENNPIESPEDAPQTKEVAPATSKTTEDTHGGDEASKESKILQTLQKMVKTQIKKKRVMKQRILVNKARVMGKARKIKRN